MKKVLYTILGLFLITLAILSYLYRDAQMNGGNTVMAKFVNKIKAVETGLDLKSYFEAKNSERTFLVLFQNETELRPGGGFVGSFGVVTVKNGKVTDSNAYDSWLLTYNNAPKIPAPIQFKDWLGVSTLEFLDSNWSPDFETNAKTALDFYAKYSAANPQYTKSFDGVIAINTKTLSSLLEYTGPIKIDGYPVEFTAKDFQTQLEKWVEVDYRQNGIANSERKAILKDLAKSVVAQVESLNASDKLKLADKLSHLLDAKDIMIYSLDPSMQLKLEKQGWAGKINQNYDNDYLLIVDANMGGLKADPYIQRQADYSVDFSGEKPLAILKLTYKYDAPGVDWKTPETFQFYSRSYTPQGSRLISVDGNYTAPIYYEKELNKQIFGLRMQIHMGKSEVLTLKYELPDTITKDNYHLLVEKQSGADRTITTSIK
jgi:hypothetical protein